MKLVVCHYHLNRGGVSRVIENHLRALAELDPSSRPSSVIVAYGGRATDWDFQIGHQLPFEVEFAELSSLEYDSENSTSQEDLFASFIEMLHEHGCETESTVLHVHNHSLGKNAALPSTVSRLAEAGWRILFQLHDFAEDLRPQNYSHLLQAAGSIDALHTSLYPQADQIHYATLNARDFETLASTGFPIERLHRLPNPVVAIGDSSSLSDTEFRTAAREKLQSAFALPPQETYVLYPVRGIQRKNLGELLLWASLCDNTTFAVTLPPLNQKELKYYEAWKKLADELSLPVLFEVGEQLTLGENYAAADAIITTSVAEGFGLVFLEAALMERPLVGRNLPGITDDFKEAGLEFPGLVDSINVPISCFDVERLKQTFSQQTQNLRKAYHAAPTASDELSRSVVALFGKDTFDFGRLDSIAQQHVIRCIQERPDLRKAIQHLNPVVTRISQPTLAKSDAVVVTNRELIEQHYSLQMIGRRLQSIYRSLSQSKITPVESQPTLAAELQNAFLRPDQMFPLRLEI